MYVLTICVCLNKPTSSCPELPSSNNLRIVVWMQAENSVYYHVMLGPSTTEISNK
jgi:hypothetical protein